MAKIAFTFVGQGAQYTGMIAELFKNRAIVRQTFEEGSDALGRDVYALCGLPQEQLNRTENTQPALVAAEVAICRLLESEGVQAEAMAGFSIGEWSALICSHTLTMEAGMKLVAARAQAMQEAVPVGEGAMVAVLGMKADAVEALCDKAGPGIWPANYNCPRQIVCSGTEQAVERLLLIAAEQELMVKKLAVSIPSHCPLMNAAAEKLAPLVERARFSVPKCPVVCNVDGAASLDPEMLRKNIIRQLSCPVQYEKSMHTLEAMDVDTFIEIGPGKVLTGLAKKTVPNIARLRVEDEKTLQETLDALAE